jgi:glucuronokinase
MKQFAAYTVEAYDALEQQNLDRLGDLMDANFDLRRQLYGDKWIGARNLEMVALAHSHGLPANFTGSGGAIVGFYEDERQFKAARRDFLERGFNFRKITPVEQASGGHFDDKLELQRLHRLSVRSAV